jgi:hypothetical protein
VICKIIGLVFDVWILASSSSAQINKIRYVIEQVIANFKTWRSMHADYRRPQATFTKPFQLSSHYTSTS